MLAYCRYRIADRQEHRERQQQRWFTGGLGTVDGVRHIAVLEQVSAEISRAIRHRRDLVRRWRVRHQLAVLVPPQFFGSQPAHALDEAALDRKSTRLNSSHVSISYAV